MSLESEIKETVRAAVLEVLREHSGATIPVSPNQLPEPLALPVEEVARLTGVTPRTVRDWIRAARERNYLQPAPAKAPIRRSSTDEQSS